jgi:hypothetical protein
MLRAMRSPTFVMLALSLLPFAALADSMRCGQWVVNETSSSAEILEKCGEPQQKDVTKEDVYAKNTIGGTHKVGVTVTERWRYQASNRVLPMLVTIVDGKVASVARAE